MVELVSTRNADYQQVSTNAILPNTKVLNNSTSLDANSACLQPKQPLTACDVSLRRLDFCRGQVSPFSFKISSKDWQSIDYKEIGAAHHTKTFNALELIGPVITKVKLFMQTLQQLKLDYNYPLPSNLILEWKSSITTLLFLNSLNTLFIRMELHALSDSLVGAYDTAFLHPFKRADLKLLN
ncbi:hypothetical protein CEXT_598681 [Caerostris extrusa]|uniref:Uncharacterized protein n=1 Tax=Caerostris extrusa TaxID=172846 RepID=A0AAV4USL6_CAEEX|nr:hypothetical protein CEXT_598681 [Caerostris extrusa]